MRSPEINPFNGRGCVRRINTALLAVLVGANTTGFGYRWIIIGRWFSDGSILSYVSRFIGSLGQAIELPVHFAGIHRRG